MPPTEVDLSKLDGSGDDLNQGDLEDEIARHVEELVNGAKAEMGDRYSMCFTPKVASAQAMADGFRQVGIAARSVHGESEDRDVVVRQFKDLDYQCLCSCAMLLEGFDAPAVSALLMARPTKSGIIYRQMLGRGLRKYPGKTHCLVVDWAWNSGKHDLFRPIDLFDTSGMDLDILKIADGLIRTGKEEDPREAIKQAEQIHRRELAARVAVREREPRYQMIAFDPFQVGQLLGIPNRHVEGGRAPTKKAREQLEALKLKADGLSQKEAQRLLEEIAARRAKGLATHRQICLLVSKGVPPEQARNFSFEDARGDLDLILGNVG
jgi:superfamily II DNA/RNA helicase